MSDFLTDSLNPQQKEAVLFTDGPLLVLAGAGSGKTRVITHRFAYLLREKNLNIQNILAVTFTNKAAGEMKERISGLTAMDTSRAWIRTFHSMGVMILRRNPESIGYESGFVIYDDVDSKNIIKGIMKEMGVNPEAFPVGSVAGAISRAKDALTSPENYSENADSEFSRVVADIFPKYEAILRKNQALDFPDLIAKPLEAFSKNPILLEKYQNLWQYIMIDEFQDTNTAQFELANLIAKKHKNICVVGDDDQSIYSWRGARSDNLFDFKKKYDAKMIRLEQNYRSTNVILKAANEIVSHIDGRLEKELWTEKKSSELIEVYECATDRQEASAIVENIRDLRSRFAYSDFAVFYRTNAQSRTLEEAFAVANIPYKIYGGQKFYDRKEIKDILAYVKLVVNPKDSASFDRIINTPKRGAGDVTVNKIKNMADLAGISYLEALTHLGQIEGIPSKARTALEDLGLILKELSESREVISPMNFVKVLIEAIGYQAYIEKFDADGRDRWANVEELINSIRVFQDNNPDLKVADFINEITLQTSIDAEGEEDSGATVSLMTIHSAKGLEFPVVFVAGVANNLIPMFSSSSTERESEEERRLFYVAVTRAKERLFLLYPLERFKFGQPIRSEASPYLDDLSDDLIKFHELKPVSNFSGGSYSSGSFGGGFSGKSTKKTYLKKSEAETYFEKKSKIKRSTASKPKGKLVEDPASLNVGQKVVHKTFGSGTVQTKTDSVLIIAFEDFGKKAFSGRSISGLYYGEEN